MASTKADGTKVAWTYSNDLGTTDYTISAKVVYVVGADAAKFGGTRAVPGNIGIPNGYKPRRVKVVGPVKEIRWPIVYDVAAALWTTPGTTVTMDVAGVDVVMTADGTKRAEKAERKATVIPGAS